MGIRLIEQAFRRLYPDKHFNYTAKLTYSVQFKGYNANVRYTLSSIHFRLSKQWQGVSEDIITGLLQSLLVKVFRKKGDPARKTMNMELYNIFLKKAHLGVIQTKSEPMLQESFDRINDRFFFGLMEPPNLVWGQQSLRKFGSYDYGADEITISKALKGRQELLDYVMYHEMLHKKHKFNHKSTRSIHHTKKFREDEKKYPDSEQLEKQLSILTRKGFFHHFLIERF